MDSQRLLSITRRWLPLLISCTILAAGVAFIASSLLPKTFEAKTTLIVGQSLSANTPDYNQLLVSQKLAATYAQVAMTQPVLARVIDDLHLATTPADLAMRARADWTLDSTLVTISAQDRDPRTAASIANAMATELIATGAAVGGSGTDFQTAVDADLAAIQKQIDQAQAELDRLLSAASPSPTDLTRADTLQARLITLRSTYATLLGSSSGSATNVLAVVDPAVAPDGPVSPRPLLNALLAGIFGLALSLGVLLLLDFLNDSVRDSQGVEQTTGLPTLGAIPRLKGDLQGKEMYRLVTLLDPRSPAAEAYRSLRTNLEFASVDSPIRSILITSAGPGEGKTITAANLAVAFAQTGRRVMLVDADLRQPGVHKIFGRTNAAGLTTILRGGDVRLATTVVPELPSLTVLMSGTLPPNPAELLGSQRMRDAIRELTAAADLVIVDSPPIGAVTDAVILSSLTDGTLLVVDAGRSRRRYVARAREALGRASARVLGALLNRVPAKDADVMAYYQEEERPSAAEPQESAGSVST